MIVNYCTKMPFVRKMSPSQCNSAWNSRSNPDGQRPTVCQPPVCRVHQGLEHRPHRSSPRNLRSNGQAESAIKIVKDYSHEPSSQDRTHTLLYSPTGVHLLMPTCDPLQRWSTNMPSGPQCHRGSGTRTPEPNRTENDSTTEPLRVLHTMTVTPGPSHHSTLDKQSRCSMMPRPFWLPATVVRQAAHGSYLVEVVGGGCYRQACDHIRERHPDAMKKGDTRPGNVAPAMPEWPGAPPAHSPPAVPTTAPVAPATTPLPTVPHSEDQHSMQDSCTHTRAFTSSTHWSCTTADRCSTCCPVPIGPCH